MVSLNVRKAEQVNQSLQFSNQIDNLAITLQRNIDRYTEFILAIADLYSISQNVSQSEFEIFVERILEENPGIQALSYSPIIDSEERLSFENTIRNQGYMSFRITERQSDGSMIEAGYRNQYVPVTIIYPWQGNEIAHGFDLMSEQSRRNALEKARDTGSVVATERIVLVQETEGENAFILFYPIFPLSINTSTSQNKEPLGYLSGVFRLSDLIEESLNDLQYEIDLSFRDIEESEEGIFLGRYHASDEEYYHTQADLIDNRKGYLCPNEDSCYRELLVGQREWKVSFTPTSTYSYSEISIEWIYVLLTGFLITIALTFYLLWTQIRFIQMQDLYQLKNNFFSTISHELRTPLASIMISAQSLEENYDKLSTIQHKDTINRIVNASKRMSTIVSNMLTIARAEFKKLDISPALFNLEVLCQEIVDDIQQIRNRENITLQKSGSFNIVYLDPVILRSILANLLDNSVNYSPDSSPIFLSISKTQKFIVFQVIDQGSGLLVSQDEDLFEAFKRGQNVDNIPGAGLGLTIVKTCIEAHEGEYSFYKNKSGGTTFIVKLPLIE